MQPYTLRVAVTPPSGHGAIVMRATRELGFEVALTVLPTQRLFAVGLAEPERFDLIQAEAWMIEELRNSDSIQPVGVGEVSGFHSLSTLFTEGMVGGVPVPERGVAPHTILYADASRRWLNSVPTICNGDTLGWRADRVHQPVTSWGDLLLPAMAGRAVLADVPAASYLELSLACQARGLANYADIGEQSRAEIDATYKVLFGLADAGHFDTLWPSFEVSIERFTSGPAAIGSLWPPAVTALQKLGAPVRYAPLQEGYRGWAGGFALSSRLDPGRRAQALAYVNWYLSGWAGAFLTRQGYYSAAPDAARAFLSRDEWAFWQLGEPAAGVIAAPDGAVIGRPGDRREGGSYETRMSNIACWSTRMAEADYVSSQWEGFRERVQSAAAGQSRIRHCASK